MDPEGRFDTGFGLVRVSMDHNLRGHAVAPGREYKEFVVQEAEFREHEAVLDIVLEKERLLLVRVKDPRGLSVEGAEVPLRGD